MCHLWCCLFLSPFVLFFLGVGWGVGCGGVHLLVFLLAGWGGVFLLCVDVLVVALCVCVFL